VIYHLSLLSFGDNLISLALLARLRDKTGVTIVGTSLTARLTPFLPNLDIPLMVVSEDVPAFYDVRKRGVRAAVRDALRVRRSLARETTPSDGLIFEKSGWRQLLLAGGMGRRSWAPARRRNVYEDRRDVLSAVFGEGIALEDTPRLTAFPRTVTINPASRLAEKAVSPDALATIVRHLRERSVDVRLIDPEERHRALRPVVTSYHAGTTLEEAVALVASSDLYIGADSLFVHVAYHCRRPMLVLYNETNLYFAPPGVAEQGSYVAFVARMSEREIQSALDERMARIAP